MKNTNPSQIASSSSFAQKKLLFSNLFRYQFLIYFLTSIALVQLFETTFAWAVQTKKCAEVFIQYDIKRIEVLTADKNTSEQNLILEKELVLHTEKAINLVPEFQFIREKAQNMNLRVWLFGGTASSFLHYVKWDLARRKGLMDLQKERFDYDYTNIFRSTQDLDIVIDATPEIAQAFQEIIAEKFPHFLGAKAKWEVRTLRYRIGKEGDLGYKESLLNDSDFNNQDTDSNSLGMIELTTDYKKNHESQIRDLKNWNQRNSVFLNDTLNNRISYFRSEKHFSTSRAKAGENPEVLSVIRLLVKAFQYELNFSESDFEKIKHIINKFDGRLLINENALRRIHDTAKKLILHAVNIEYAINTLDKLGLRQKLIAMGDVNDINSDAWWLNREPLRSFPIGEGKGPTAKELGITIVAHETNSFLAYESITRAHSGEPNVLISRENAVGEAAVFGDGFYTKIGKEGARGTGLTIRFLVNPKAREGTDFIVKDNFIIFKNKKTLTIIQESLNFGLDDLLKLAESHKDFEIDHSNLALLEKLKRKLNATKINEELNKLLNSSSQADQNRLIYILSAFQDSNISKLIDYDVFISVVKNIYRHISFLEHSTSETELLRYIQTIGPIIKTLDVLKILERKVFLDFLVKLLETHTVHFEFRKEVLFEYLLTINSETEILSLQNIFNSNEELRAVQNEIQNWYLSKDIRKVNFLFKLNLEWSIAIRNEDLNSLILFINSGIFNINHKNISNVSILQLAAYYNHTNLIEWIIKNTDFDFNARNKLGYTEVEQLLLSGKPALAHLIMQYRPEVRFKNLQIKERNTDGTPIIDFIRIESGSFLMADGRGHNHNILTTISKPFEFMSVHMSQKTYQSVVNLLIQNISNEFNQTMFTHFEGVRDENHPVNYVTYYEVELWLDGLNKLSRLQNTHIHKELEILFPGHSYGAKYRLPTNAEWELTARLGGVAEGNYSFGTSESEVPNYVIYNKNSVSNPEPIGSKKPVFYNGKPIYDIQGNVWVWTSDWYSEQLTGGLDPKGPATGTLRRIRGGNWGNDEKIISLNNSQFSFNPQGCSGGGGFRIVRGIN